MVIPIIPTMPLEEKRSHVAIPNIHDIFRRSNYVKDLVSWYNDTYGLRDLFIRLKTQIDVSVFGVSDKIYLGDDGWLFYRSVIDQEEVTVEDFLGKENNLNKVISGAYKLSKLLAKKNIKLLVSIMPMKDEFYGDHLPRFASKLPIHQEINLLEAKLKEISEISYIDVKSQLRKIYETRQVFHRTDFHWNDPAGFEIAKSIVNHIGNIEHKQPPIWQHELEINIARISGGEANFMPLFYVPTEQTLMVKQNWTMPTNHEIKTFPFQWVMSKVNPSQTELHPILIIGDSFFDAMVRSGITLYFQKMYFCNFKEISAYDILKYLPDDVDYLYLEFIDVSMPALLALREFNDLPE